MPDSTLHFVRMREKDSPLFVDPEAELRRIVPTAFAAVVRALMDSGEKDAADAIDSIFNVFTIRLDEDPSSVCDQMEAFKNALSFSEIGLLFLSLLLKYSICLSVYLKPTFVETTPFILYLCSG